MISDLVLHPVNTTYLGIETTEAIERELSDAFAFDVEGAQYSVAFKKHRWDGKIRLFNRVTRRIYAGLRTRVRAFASERGYSVEDRLETAIPYSTDDALAHIAPLKLKVPPRDYQIEAVRYALEQKRCMLLSATGSGKSLILYILSQATDGKVLVLVPTIALVDQMYQDFIDYGAKARTMTKIRGGLEKRAKTHITISTWQSLQKLDNEFFEQFDMVLGDECHRSSAAATKRILEACTDATYRIGCTGTLEETKTHALVLEGLFGVVKHVAKTHELQARGTLAQIKVTQMVLQYAPAESTTFPFSADEKVDHRTEIDYIVQIPKRNQFLVQLALSRSATENVLILFTYVDKHGRVLYDNLTSRQHDRHVHFIAGETDVSERLETTSILAHHTGNIVVASYGTFAVGINIPNLHTIILASSAKSQYRVLQSIGRGLRMHASKLSRPLRVLDIVDDFRCFNHYNYTLKHARVRATYYQNEQFPFTLKTYPFLI